MESVHVVVQTTTKVAMAGSWGWGWVKETGTDNDR